MSLQSELPAHLKANNLTFSEKPLTLEYETLLLELEQKINNLAGFLMATFFRDDTWLVGQAVAYDFPLLEKDEDQKRDWDKEKELTQRIASDLGDRLAYYEAAYHFPRELCDLKAKCAQERLRWKAKNNQQSPSELAKEIFLEVADKISTESANFQDFLASASFQKAFTITLDRKTGDYQISDLKLDSIKLQMAWCELLTWL